MTDHRAPSSPVTAPACNLCRFWVSAVDQPRNGQTLKEGEGECRRRAPVGGGVTAYFTAGKNPNRMIAVMYPWPLAHEKDWCGEFEPSPARQQQ